MSEEKEEEEKEPGRHSNPENQQKPRYETPSWDFIVSQMSLYEIPPVFAQYSVGDALSITDIVPLRPALFGIGSPTLVKTNSLLCKVCRCKGSLFSCGGCGKKYYCSTKCQKTDWKAGHEAKCTGVSRVA